MDVKRAYLMLVHEMANHGLLEKGWTFGLDNGKRRFGVCKKQKKQITISKYLSHLNTEIEVKDTILHEIAHALAIERKLDDNHGPQWKSIAREIGCNAQRCHTAISVPGRFVYECPCCKTTTLRHKRIIRPIACKSCCNKYNNGRYTTLYLFKPRVNT